PDATAFAALGLIAILSILAHYAGIVALRRADASLVGLFDYLRLLWAAMIGLTIFGETPDLATMIGSTLIVAAALLPIALDRQKWMDRVG
ncbi:MAG: DMT family transporter, partial [Pseudomonadota bacterium]